MPDAMPTGEDLSTALRAGCLSPPSRVSESWELRLRPLRTCFWDLG